MISGRQALEAIEQAIGRARADEHQLEGKLRKLSEEAVRLRAQRMEAFRELGRLKLDALTRATVLGELDAIERRALAILDDRRQALEQLTARRAEAEGKVQRAEAERHAKAAALEEALDRVQDLRLKVEADARVSSEWAAQRVRIDQAAETATQAEAKAKQAEADREQKRKPYEADPLFMYLWRRRFGTAEYRASPFVRFFDRKVARLVGYDKARANYTLLNEIPLRLREHAARIGKEVEAERARLTAVERGALVTAGVEPLEEAVREAKAALDEAEARLTEARGVLADFDRRHDTSVLEGDVPFKEAVELLARADAEQDLQALYRKARATPTPADDALVRRIETAETAIGLTEQEIGRIRQELRTLAHRRTEIERERDAFRQRGYDNPYGTIGNETVVMNVLGGILGGIIQGAVLGQVLNQGYHRRSGPWDSDFGGGVFPFPDAGGGSGGFPFPDAGGGSMGGGGFSTGGGFGGGGGGFRTGGGF